MTASTARAAAVIALVAAIVAVIIAAPADARRAPAQPPGTVTLTTANYARVGTLHCGRITGSWRAGRVISRTRTGLRFVTLSREAQTLRGRATTRAQRIRAQRAIQRAAAANRRCVPPAVRMTPTMPTTAPMTAPITVSAVRFRSLQGQRALAIGGSSDFAPGSRAYLSTAAGAAPANEGDLLVIAPDGTPAPAIETPQAPAVVQTVVAPQGHAYVLLERPYALPDGAMCRILRIPAAGGDGTCVEGDIWVFTNGRADLANLAMQTDAWGALYYAGTIKGRYVMRRWHDGAMQDLLREGESMLYDFLVTPQGSVVLSGTRTDGSTFTRTTDGADLAPRAARWMRMLDVQGAAQPVLAFSQQPNDSGWRVLREGTLTAPTLLACPTPSDLAACAGADAVSITASLADGTIAGIAPATDSTPRAFVLWNRRGDAPAAIDDGGISDVIDMIASGNTLALASSRGEIALWQDGVARRIDLSGMVPGALRARDGEVWFDATRGSQSGIGRITLADGNATFTPTDPIADLQMLPG